MIRYIFGLLFILVGIVATSFWVNAESPIIYLPENDFEASVELNITYIDMIFSYGYTVTNSPNSRQSIWALRMDHNDLSQNKNSIQGPANWDVDNAIDQVGTNFSLWSADPVDPDSEEEFTTIPPRSAIAPGQAMAGFSLTNRSGPPKIVEVSMKGWAPLPILDESENVFIVGDTIIENSDSYASNIFDGNYPNQNERENSVIVATLGPTHPVTDLSLLCDTFIVNLIDQVRWAADLGWIKSNAIDTNTDVDAGKGKGLGHKKGKGQGHDKGKGKGHDKYDIGDIPIIEKEIIESLQEIRGACILGRFSDARTGLNEIIVKINDGRNELLSAEAYFLIKFNAEFLLKKF